MCGYGFTEGIDFKAIFQKWNTAQGNETTQTDHQLTIPMAKEICMLQRSDKGKEFRQYFLKIEEQWNTPELVMARALKLANRKIDEMTTVNNNSKDRYGKYHNEVVYEIIFNRSESK